MSTVAVVSPKKLIEVAMPLDAINTAAAREKSIRHGHPSTLHLWWARRPLAAARAVIFGQLVHDPEDLWRCQNPGVEPKPQHKSAWTKARGRLFKIIEELVLWENTTNETVLNAAREAIRESWRQTCELNKNHPQVQELFNPDKMPGLHDPFAGGGTIPLEAQRLGLEAYASDLNPVAVLINKAMIEIPPKFAGQPPVHPETRRNSQYQLREWKGSAGLAEDVRRYGEWMRDEAFNRIGHLYPPIEITKAMVKERPDLEQYEGEKLTVIAWLWARTVKSPNPAFSHVEVPLTSSFVLSSRPGKEAYIRPIITQGHYTFGVESGLAPDHLVLGTKVGMRTAFRCVMSNTPIAYSYIRNEFLSGRMGQRLMAIVAEGAHSRVFLPPSTAHELLAQSCTPKWRPDTPIVPGMSERVVGYGLNTYGHLFTDRQLVALTVLSDLVTEVRERVHRDAAIALPSDDTRGLEEGGHGARAYAEATSVYLAFAVDRVVERHTSLAIWDSTPTKLQLANTFRRQSLPMSWDFAEGNPFCTSSGTWTPSVEWVAKAIDSLPNTRRGSAAQADAASPKNTRGQGSFISTDPPYYDNIGYADLSDFFYLWLRRSLRGIYPSLFSTMSVPKAEELVAASHRHGSKEHAEAFFLDGMTRAMNALSERATPGVPITIYYAFKQAETGDAGTNSTGWETFLDAVIRAGLAITGTWPIRTEMLGQLKKKLNALASSIVLVCRPRAARSGTISRRQFVRMLNEALPLALDAMTRESEGLHSPVAPVDLSQAIIGPGMAIFSRYDAVLEADGTPMSVRTALQLINRFLAEDDFDADTQFCLHWFEQHGWNAGKFGEADTLARAKSTSVEGVKQAGVIEAGGGNVRLLSWREYPADWDPRSDARLPVWEALHQLIRAYQTQGDGGAAQVLAGVAGKAEAARQLAYRLYTLCERKGWAEEARAYNEVVTGWSGVEAAAAKIPGASQGLLFDSTKETP